MTNMYPLTHWGRDEIDAILQTTFLNASSFMKMYEFWSKFHWFVPRVQLTIFQDWSSYWLDNHLYIYTMNFVRIGSCNGLSHAPSQYLHMGCIQWHMKVWLWNDNCTVDNESLPILIEIVSLSDIFKNFILEAMQIQFHCVFICRYPMLTR